MVPSAVLELAEGPDGRFAGLAESPKRRYKYCFNHSLASWASVKFFIGMGGDWKLNSIFIMKLASPGSEIIAIAV
jgi:hypothetical protein